MKIIFYIIVKIVEDIVGIDIPRKELKRLKEEYKINFYANVLYKSKVPKKRRNLKCVGCQEAFVYKTKKLMKKGLYIEVIDNLEILYYEKGLGYRINDYYNVKIEKDMINKSFLKNQKLLLDEFFGKYSGVSSKMYNNNIIVIPSAVFAGIITEVIKNEMFNQNNINFINILSSIIIIVFIYCVLFYFIFTNARKMFRSLDKETFYGFCLEAVNNLLKDADGY